MTVMTAPRGALDRAPRPSGLYDVLELILDKGLVIDIYVRVSLVGIELLTVDARIVVASVDTYLRFAEAVNRLDLTQTKDGKTLPEFIGDMQEGGAKGKVQGALSGAGDAFSEAFHRGRDDEEEGGNGASRQRERQPARRPRRRRSQEDEG